MRSACAWVLVLASGLAALGVESTRPPSAPRPLAPAESAMVPFTNRVEFIWSQAKRAEKYTVYVGKDGKTFTNVNVWGATQTNLVVEAPFRAGQYTWMVMGRNAAGAGPWSTTATFRVSERWMSPGGWERLAVTNPPVFRWANTPGATFYRARIEVYTAPADSWNPTNANGRYRRVYEGPAPRDGEGNWAPTGLAFQAATYRWQVREKAGGVWAPWSMPSYFRIDVPGPVKPLAPRRGAVTTDQPTYQWKPGSQVMNVYCQIRVWKNGIVRNTYTGMASSPFATPDGYELPGPGAVSWQIRSFEVFPGDVWRYGVWSEALPFTVQ